LNETASIPLQKVTKTGNNEKTTDDNRTANPPIQPKAVSAVITKPVPVATQNQPANYNQRPASISISKPNTVHSAPEAYAETKKAQVQMNEKFDDKALLEAWNEFGKTINDEIKMIGFQNTSLPVRVSELEFEVHVNNVMQENELKKIQPDIVQFLSNRLMNSAVKMTIKLVEETDSQRSLLPEERYKMMVEQNPSLEKLRKNLQLEID